MSNAGILSGAHNFVLNKPVFNDVRNTVPYKKGSGLKVLLKKSMPDAFHDSSARDPPPSCHPGTRHDFIDTITSWGLGTLQHVKPMLWMYGPAGVGKSAIAQTCSEGLAERNKLGAALFFSRSVGSNKRNDPHRLFPSLAYQIATKYDAYGDILDRRIQKNPTLVTKSIKEQFQELLVKPLSQLGVDAAGVFEGLVIVIDGLDECGKGPGTHCDIIKIVATSVRNRTTPFRWVFFSRPETHIVGSFTANDTRPLTYQLEIRVSRKIDNEITLYLTGGLREIQRRNGLSDSWVSERDIGVLVNISGGLFIYAATVIRFIGSHELFGPVDQLRAVLALASDNKGAGPVHPLSELDLFYTLIMRCVPPGILPRILVILLLTFCVRTDPIPELRWFQDLPSVIWIANIIDLSEAQFRNACGPLHSVLELDPSPEIKFYHASFMDFLRDPSRSGEFCIFTRLDSLRLELLQRLNNVYSAASPEEPIHLNLTWSIPGLEDSTFYRILVRIFFNLCQWDGHPLDSLTSEALLNFQFHMIPLVRNSALIDRVGHNPPKLRENIHPDFRDRIVRRTYNPVAYLRVPIDASWKDLYILGCRKNKIICWRYKDDDWRLSRYPTWFKS
ncbi:hypothetical protein P691DRAFT_811901 [Macrolepiota fuliginosa MF-IS2]|uniref:Nephrocystin 3-like N-terminal domain-containing protein n=1 Tax=Macrolepiota fuliginosa MF-IS2 TaxID=1400762 RepID=A0A9P5X1Y5_9AGAR|nr:hypothetical protein P691DRAFT_811901 [Macrolepiota fuliginosa MF-IS2]